MVPKTFSAILLATIIKPVVGCVGQDMSWWSKRKGCRSNSESPTPGFFRAGFSDNPDQLAWFAGIGVGLGTKCSARTRMLQAWYLVTPQGAAMVYSIELDT